jgi:hypothetical protein
MEYAVHCSNIGNVHTGDNEKEARDKFSHYRELTAIPGSRAYGETVTFWVDDEPVDEYDGSGHIRPEREHYEIEE